MLISLVNHYSGISPCSRLQVYPQWTGLQFIRFYSSSVSYWGQKQARCRLPYRLPVTPFSSVTSSLHPSSLPTVLPILLRLWMYRIRRHRWQGQREKTKPQPSAAELISHNPHTLDPAVSSHSPPLSLPFVWIPRNFVLLFSPVTLLKSCCIMSHWAHTQTDILYLAMTMYSSATVQCHLKYNAHTLSENHAWKVMHVHARKHTLLCLHADTVRKWNLSLTVGEVGGCEWLSNTVSKNTVVL